MLTPPCPIHFILIVFYLVSYFTLPSLSHIIIQKNNQKSLLYNGNLNVISHENHLPNQLVLQVDGTIDSEDLDNQKKHLESLTKDAFLENLIWDSYRWNLVNGRFLSNPPALHKHRVFTHKGKQYIMGGTSYSDSNGTTFESDFISGEFVNVTDNYAINKAFVCSFEHIVLSYSGVSEDLIRGFQIIDGVPTWVTLSVLPHHTKGGETIACVPAQPGTYNFSRMMVFGDFSPSDPPLEIHIPHYLETFEDYNLPIREIEPLSDTILGGIAGYLNGHLIVGFGDGIEACWEYSFSEGSYTPLGIDGTSSTRNFAYSAYVQYKDSLYLGGGATNPGRYFRMDYDPSDTVLYINELFCWMDSNGPDDYLYYRQIFVLPIQVPFPDTEWIRLIIYGGYSVAEDELYSSVYEAILPHQKEPF